MIRSILFTCGLQNSGYMSENVNDKDTIWSYHIDITKNILSHEIPILLNCFIHTENRPERGGFQLLSIKLYILEFQRWNG